MALDDNSLASLKIDRNAAASRSPRAALWALAALVLVAGVVALWLLRERPIKVEVATAVPAPSGAQTRGTAVLDASGYVVARREATVSSKVTGKIAEVLIEEGMVVTQGQILARLDDASLQPQLELARTQLRARATDQDETQVRLAEAGRNLARIKRLRAAALISEADLDSAQAGLDALEARLKGLAAAIEVAAATVRVYEQQLGDLTVRAPFAGVIVSKDAQPGEMVSPVSAGGGFTRTGIATLVDMDSREIEVDVNEAFINRVSAGQHTEATLDAYPDWRVASHVINIVPTADRQKATVRVRIAFDNLDPRILPNMGVKVSFLEAAATAASASAGSAARPPVRVPATAAVRDGDTTYVWRLRGNTVERIAVTTGRERDGQIELLSGIAASDTVVTRPVAGLAPGAVVVPTGK
ncbi:MAG: efflux RND transporter periplasmic adaptor subunit [Steroidobacteraceae bacterium]